LIFWLFLTGGGHGHSHGGPAKGHSRHGTHSHLAALADEEDDTVTIL